jgi:hypothetical protein
VTPERYDLVVIGGGPAGEKGAAQAADLFIQAVFNYPTLGEAYEYAAYDGLRALAREGAEPGKPAPAPRDARRRGAPRGG